MDTNFADLDSRTTGNDGGSYVVAGPDWKGGETLDAPKHNYIITFDPSTRRRRLSPPAVQKVP